MEDKYSEMIKGCKANKRSAQKELYEHFSDKMFGVCMYYTKDRTEAEDVLHEGFMKVFKYIGQYKGNGSFEGWVRRIMINTALGKYRKKHKMYAVAEVHDQIENLNFDEVTSYISAADLMSLIGELSPQYKMVFNLYAIEGYSHKEIGKKLEISEGTSKSNLSRARVVLQKKVKEHFYVPSNKKILR